MFDDSAFALMRVMISAGFVEGAVRVIVSISDAAVIGYGLKPGIISYVSSSQHRLDSMPDEAIRSLIVAPLLTRARSVIDQCGLKDHVAAGRN